MDKPQALIVEDEHDLALIFARALHAAGFETDIVRSGDVALTWLSTEVPDLVVLDLHLPRVEGIDILQHIRTEPRLANTHVIVATAYPHMAETLHETADWVFFKPVGFSQLRDMAARLAATASSNRSNEQTSE